MSTYHPTPRNAVTSLTRGAKPIHAAAHRPTLNITGREHCAHCSNVGIVILDPHPDQQTQDYGAPCPMCQAGQNRNHHDHNGQYWRITDIATTSWQNGATRSHTTKCSIQAQDGSPYPCGLPAINHKCNHHTAAAQAKRETA